MSDQTITHLHLSLKEINRRIERLTRIVDRLDVLAYRHKRLSKAYKELSLYSVQLAENLEQIDVLAFEVRQELNFLRKRTALSTKDYTIYTK